LIVAESPVKTLPVGAATVRKDKLFQIVRKHCSPEREEDQALVIESFDDPTVSAPTAEEKSIRIGTRNAVRKFARLSAKIGLFSERTHLALKPQLQADVIINMADGTPEQLAVQLASQITQLLPAKILVCAAGRQ
jgi:hypothetical protein